MIRWANRYTHLFTKQSLWIMLFLLVGCMLVLPSQPLSAKSHPHSTSKCRDVTIPATISSGPVSIYGKFCTPKVGNPSTVQLLVHGATYNHLYWDFPGFDGKYSYTKAANAAGYATLAIDRLGTGESTRPASSDVTYDAQISVLHQVVQALRTNIDGDKFKKVMMLGHSFGSAYTIGEVATYQDVDAVILTGNGHQVSKLTQEQSVSFFHPANTEPRFSGLDPGYVTTIPGVRDDGGFLYDMSRADPAVVAVDEATKDVISSAEFATRPPNLGTLSTKIKVPVLIATGQQDTHYCGEGANDCTSSETFYAAEAPYYNTCMAVLFLKSGHDINLHTTAESSFAKLIGWSHMTLSPHASKARCSVTGGISQY
jgi:pimeloyl-ACP methyl ester carboxylesterase